jgi:hypothetical protein
MTNVKYQITLSIISDDPIAATNALAQIKKLDGILAQPVESNSNTPGYQQFNLDIQPPAQPDKAPLLWSPPFPNEVDAWQERALLQLS